MEHIKDILCPDCNENEINEERFNTYGKCRTCQRREILSKTKGVKYIKYKDLPQKEKDRLQRLRNYNNKYVESKKANIERTPFGEPIPDIKMRHSPNQIYTSDMVKYLLKIADGTQTAVDLKDMLIAKYPNKDINGHNLNNILSRYKIPYIKRPCGSRKSSVKEIKEVINEVNTPIENITLNMDEIDVELDLQDGLDNLENHTELDDVESTLNSYEQISADYCNLVNTKVEEPERFIPIRDEVTQVLNDKFKKSNCFLEKSYSIDDYINMLEMLYHLSNNTSNIMHSRYMQYNIANKYQDDILHAIEIEVAPDGDTYLTDKLHILRGIRRNCERDKDAVYKMQPFLKLIDRNALKVALGNLKRYQLVKDSIKFVPSVDVQMIEQYNWAVDTIPTELVYEQHNAKVKDYMETTFGPDVIEEPVEKVKVQAPEPKCIENKVKETAPSNSVKSTTKGNKIFNFRVSCKISGGGYGAFAHWHHDYSCEKAETALAYATNTLNQLKRNKGIMWQDIDVVPLNNSVTVDIEIPKEPTKPTTPIKLVDKQIASAMDKEIIEFKTRCVTTKYLGGTTTNSNNKRFRVACDVSSPGFEQPRTWKKIYMCSEPELAVKDAHEMLSELQYKYPNTTIGDIRIEQL